MTNEAISQRLHGILQSDEFSGNAQARVLEILRAYFHRFETWAQHLGFWPRLVLLVACLALLAGIAAQVVMALRQASLSASVGAFAQTTPGDDQVTAALLFDKSAALANAGQLRDAARALQQAVWVHMCREREVPWRASRADWEWVDILRPSGRIVNFTRSTQSLAFGPEPSRASYETCAREAAALLRTDTRGVPGSPA